MMDIDNRKQFSPSPIVESPPPYEPHHAAMIEWAKASSSLTARVMRRLADGDTKSPKHGPFEKRMKP